MYAPETGRFLQRDPIQRKKAPDVYSLVGGLPTILVDPMGLAAAFVDETPLIDTTASMDPETAAMIYRFSLQVSPIPDNFSLNRPPLAQPFFLRVVPVPDSFWLSPTPSSRALDWGESVIPGTEPPETEYQTNDTQLFDCCECREVDESGNLREGQYRPPPGGFDGCIENGFPEGYTIVRKHRGGCFNPDGANYQTWVCRDISNPRRRGSISSRWFPEPGERKTRCVTRR